MVLCGAAWLMTKHRLVARALRAQGRVIGYEEKRDSDGSTFAPIFTFVDANGKKHTLTRGWSTDLKAHRVGEPVEILYLREQPEKARIHSLSDIYGLPVILSATGAVIAIWA